jgi:zinc transport system substrate-binding protein
LGSFIINKKTICSIVICIGLFTILLSGCIYQSSTKRIGVLVTIIPQLEIVENIGREYIDVTVMVPAGESPHSFEPTPKQMIKVVQASAYFKVGSGVEFEISHMDTILEQNPDLSIFDCSQDINIISFDEHYGLNDYHEIENNHDYEGTDPHIWLSPFNFKKMAEVIYNGLIEIDPDHKQYYYSNYQTYISHLDSLHSNVSSMLQLYENKSFMVYHPAWGYFGDTYKLKMVSIEDEGKQPGPAGVAAIIDQANNENITIIFVAPQFDSSSAETIATEIGGKVIYANPLMTNFESTINQLVEDMVSGFENN